MKENSNTGCPRPPPPVQQVPKPQTAEMSPPLLFCALAPPLSLEETLLWSPMAAVTFSCTNPALSFWVAPLSAAFTQHVVLHPRKWKQYFKTPNCCVFKWQEQHRIASGPLSCSAPVLPHKQ